MLAMLRDMGKPQSIVERIVREAGVPDLWQAFDRIAPTDLSSLLLEVFRHRSEQVTPAELLSRYEQHRALAPSSADPRVLLEIDRALFSVLGEFEPIELGPLCPFGLVHALGGIDQNNTLAALRGTELLSDPTSMHALECARRRRRARDVDVRLASSSRVVRMQPFDFPGASAHFRLIAFSSAGRGARFELEALREHIGVHLALLEELRNGFAFTNTRVDLSHPGLVGARLRAAGIERDALRGVVAAHRPGGSSTFLAERGLVLPHDFADPNDANVALSDAERHVLERMRASVAPLAEGSNATFRFDLSRLEGVGYYVGPCFRITATDPEGAALPLSDGGITDWTQRLLSDRSERLMTSGIGSELIAKRFRA